MANGQIRWGILGTGKIAGEFAQGLQRLPDAQLLAVGSRAKTTAERFAKRYQVPRVYSSYTDLVQDPDVEVIYVATPHVTHKEYCLLCLEAGKAVLCEKPFTVNAAEAAEVIALAREKELFCMEAMWMRFLPAVQEARRLVQANAIGDIQMIQASLGFLMEYDPSHRAFNRDLGGGALLDLGVYPLSLIIQHLGIPDSITSHAHLGETGVDEQAAVILGYADGKLGILNTSLRTYNANDALFMGSAGQIHLHAPLYRPEGLSVQKHTLVVGGGATQATDSAPTGGVTAKLRQIEPLRNLYRRAKPLLAPLLGLQERRLALPAAGNGYHYEAAEVMACLRRGATESDIMPLDETLRIMETMDTIRAQWQLRYPQEA
ncbi:MAG: Gfo/Idh/MocA family oxidoreductase [Caldilineaceae bacterium]|nr:Gfo/Idh/MocA family oxidoreductase [Caldilineaceae bacterium]